MLLIVFRKHGAPSDYVPPAKPYTPPLRLPVDKDLQARLQREWLERAKSFLYLLLPEVVRSNDPYYALGTIAKSFDNEYAHQVEGFDTLLAGVSPHTVNRSYLVEGAPIFFSPEQFVLVASSTASDTTLSSLPSSNSLDGALVGFGIYVHQDKGNPIAEGQYRKVTKHYGGSNAVTVSPDWTFIPSNNAVIALCYPDRVWLPTEIIVHKDLPYGTTLERSVNEYDVVILPHRYYIAEVDGYYEDWEIQFIEGANPGFRAKIVEFDASGRAGLNRQLPITAKYGDFFRLIPPRFNAESTVDGFYEGRYLRVVGLGAAHQYGQGHGEQVRKIIHSEFSIGGSLDREFTTGPATQVVFVHDPQTGEGERLDIPPAPDSMLGVINHYIPLQRLASNIGLPLSDNSSDEEHRAQIHYAFQVWKSRGTIEGIELACRVHGIRARVTEYSQDFAPGADNLNVGPGTGGHSYTRYPWGDNSPPIEDLDARYPPITWQDPAVASAQRIPSSDISIEINHVLTSPLTVSVFQDIRNYLDLSRPIHIEIYRVLIAIQFTPVVGVSEEFHLDGEIIFKENKIQASDSPVRLLINGLSSLTFPLSVGVRERFKIVDTRYDMGNRYDSESSFTDAGD
jgi:hypothetical protein